MSKTAMATTMRRGHFLRKRGGDFFHDEGLQDVSDLHVLVPRDADAALEACLTSTRRP